MEISDLTLELNDLSSFSFTSPSQEISDGVRTSARAVQAAEVGIRRMGAVAASQVFAMLQERATVPVQAVKPVVANAAETTRQAVLQAQRAVLTLASHPQLSRWFWKSLNEEVSQEEKQQELFSSERSDNTV
ncbi:uncharacterized protein LOC9643848 isoform X1 [Selaginella moellendorffii]|nr:uncharacterized protein LOC9643848 isoform X1 [Selaginella moellendorffii]|eukprot:XP_024544611.1 uncharacterized protein LOC9643848 isoform X1 [Selaginella moellendorffii]